MGVFHQTSTPLSKQKFAVIVNEKEDENAVCEKFSSVQSRTQKRLEVNS